VLARLLELGEGLGRQPLELLLVHGIDQDEPGDRVGVLGREQADVAAPEAVPHQHQWAGKAQHTERLVQVGDHGGSVRSTVGRIAEPLPGPVVGDDRRPLCQLPVEPGHRRGGEQTHPDQSRHTPSSDAQDPTRDAAPRAHRPAVSSAGVIVWT
jgi:hypothetical protein